MGYHKKSICKGEYGHSSKIREELEELEDAEDQGIKIMALVELSDIIGAIDGYLERNYPIIRLEDLISMAKITRVAFKDGSRK